jgi:acyl-CoA dehydrogenase
MLGGQGVTGETIVMRIFLDMRAFRIYDGPSEVHRWSMARKILDAADKRAGAHTGVHAGVHTGVKA